MLARKSNWGHSMLYDSTFWNLIFGFLISLWFAGVLPKYFSSEWSVAQFHLQEGLQHIVAFGHQKNVVVILGMDGR